jgi:hypothetical protein
VQQHHQQCCRAGAASFCIPRVAALEHYVPYVYVLKAKPKRIRLFAGRLYDKKI